MHRWLAAALVFGCLGSTGCSVWSYAWLVNVSERKLFCEEEDDAISMATYRSWADEAWAETGACCPEDCLSLDYSWGFREGFAEFVYAGGDGEPPAMPPRIYWQADMRSREGAAAVASWFEGYRHGARVAKEGGYRDATTIRLSGSLRDCDACGCPDKTCPLPPPTRVDVSGPSLDGPDVVAPPEEVVIPLQEPVAPEMTPLNEGGESLPSMDDSPQAEPGPTPAPALEPVAAQVINNGRVRTALFQIVR
jgi:hypothetical protein